jgi:hypothetical protein
MTLAIQFGATLRAAMTLRYMQRQMTCCIIILWLYNSPYRRSVFAL